MLLFVRNSQVVQCLVRSFKSEIAWPSFSFNHHTNLPLLKLNLMDLISRKTQYLEKDIKKQCSFSSCRPALNISFSYFFWRLTAVAATAATFAAATAAPFAASAAAAPTITAAAHSITASAASSATVVASVVASSLGKLLRRCIFLGRFTVGYLRNLLHFVVPWHFCTRIFIFTEVFLV